MEKKMSVDLAVAIGMQQNSQNLMVCKLDYSNLPLYRNKISFNLKDHKINYNISNFTIKKVIQFLLNNLDNYNINVEIHGNDFTHNYGINIINDIKINLDKLIQDKLCKYIEINKNILKQELFEEIILENILIKRNAKSFHQNDDLIRKIIHEKIYAEIDNYKIKFDNLVCLGGEMYIYGKILENFYNFGYFFSDTKSIIDDSKINIDKLHKKIELINYEKDTIFDKINKNENLLIINISKSGLKKNLGYQVLSHKFNKIIYISCNQKSFLNDFLILENQYKIYKYIEFAKINIYFFEK